MRRAPPSTTRKTRADGLCAEKTFFATRCAWCCVNEAHHNYVSFSACMRTVFVATFTPIRSRTVQLIRFSIKRSRQECPKCQSDAGKHPVLSIRDTVSSHQQWTPPRLATAHGARRRHSTALRAMRTRRMSILANRNILPDSPTIESVAEDSAEASVEDTMLVDAVALAHASGSFDVDLPICKRGILVADCASQSVVAAAAVD